VVLGTEKAMIISISTCCHWRETTIRRAKDDIDTIVLEHVLHPTVSGYVSEMLQVPLIRISGGVLIHGLDQYI
jgi:hypothetical protein